MLPDNPPFHSLAQLLKGTADPLRLDILRALKADSFGVLELCEIMAMKQSGMSHHLKVLAQGGLVERRREGNSIFYRRILADQGTAAGQLLAALFQVIDSIDLDSSIQTSIAHIKAEREDAAREFFDRHADAFRAQQELIAPFEHYADSVTDLLLQTGPQPTQSALEIGPGEGAYLPTLARLFHSVTAIDISGEMLEKAQALVQQQQLGNVTLLKSDTTEAAKKQLCVDRLVCNMVLHHVPSPADVFHDCTRLLKQGGSLIVTDLSRHDQDWTRKMCGDLWQGFDPEELTGWAENAGLISKESLYLGLRNGFQIQIRRFDKPEH